MAGIGTWLDAGALAVGLGSGLLALGEGALEERMTELLEFTRQWGTRA